MTITNDYVFNYHLFNKVIIITKTNRPFSKVIDPLWVSSLSNKVKLLERHIEELNADRDKLSALKDDLLLKLEVCEADVRDQNEALQLATIQFNTERKQTAEENQRANGELKASLELRRSLEREVGALRERLSEKERLCEQLNVEKSFLEGQASKEDLFFFTFNKPKG